MKKPQKLKSIKIKLVSSLSDFTSKSLDKFVSKHEINKNVDWSKTTQWTVTTESDKGFLILRYLKLKSGKRIKERLDADLYKDLRHDQDGCEEICRILNYRHRSKMDALEAWKIKTAFIQDKDSKLHERFEDFLLMRSGNRQHVKRCRAMVQQHFLNYFYYERNPALYDYQDWVSQKVRVEYLQYLLSKKVKSTRNKNRTVPLSAKTIKTIIQNVNQFFQFLHIESEEKIPLMKLSFPNATDATFRDHNHKRSKFLDKKTPSEEYIDEVTFKKIYSAAPENIKSAIWLAYHFGLRRSEVLAIKLENVRNQHLKVLEQVVGVDTERAEDMKGISSIARTGPLKNRKEVGRKVPYWFSNPKEAFEQISKLQIMHPSGLSKEWIELMKRLNMSYTFHNLRNAFCSNSLRDSEKLKISPSDVQLALGHSDIRTTMIYLRDYRQLDDDRVWTPESEAS